MSINLNNTVAGGSVNITLTWIISYIQTNINKFAAKDIPGKTSPTMDTDTFVVRPRRYRIRARVTDSEKSVLESLDNEPNRQCKLSDGEQSNKNVRSITVEFENRPGYTDHPWIAIIELQGEEH